MLSNVFNNSMPLVFSLIVLDFSVDRVFKEELNLMLAEASQGAVGLSL